MEKLEHLNCSSEQKAAWIEKCQRYCKSIKNADLARNREALIYHYVTEGDVKANKIHRYPEERYIATLKIEAPPNVYPLQTPEVTFGGVIGGNAPECSQCKSRGDSNVRDWITQMVQKRSNDEPTSYFHQCRKCNFIYFDR